MVRQVDGHDDRRVTLASQIPLLSQRIDTIERDARDREGRMEKLEDRSEATLILAVKIDNMGEKLTRIEHKMESFEKAAESWNQFLVTDLNARATIDQTKRRDANTALLTLLGIGITALLGTVTAIITILGLVFRAAGH